MARIVSDIEPGRYGLSCGCILEIDRRQMLVQRPSDLQLLAQTEARDHDAKCPRQIREIRGLGASLIVADETGPWVPKRVPKRVPKPDRNWIGVDFGQDFTGVYEGVYETMRRQMMEYMKPDEPKEPEIFLKYFPCSTSGCRVEAVGYFDYYFRCEKHKPPVKYGPEEPPKEDQALTRFSLIELD